MTSRRNVTGLSFATRRRTDAPGWCAPVRPRAPGRAGAHPAGNGFPIAARHMPPRWAQSKISSSSAVAFVVAKLCRRAAWLSLTRDVLRDAFRPNHRDTGDVGKIRNSVGNHE